MELANLFGDMPIQLSEELSQVLWQTPSLRVERIVSHGHVTAPGQWYDQDTDEWVVLLTGSARLRLADPEELLELKAGDYLLLPAHRRHRVEWTAPDRPCIWLALHTPAVEESDWSNGGESLH